MLPSFEVIDLAITSLHGGRDRRWSVIGLLLDSIEKTRYWATKSPSFTQWLKNFAEDMGLKEASLWRYLMSYRYALQLYDDLLAKGIPCPPLESLLEQLSAEHLEVFSKIARAAPESTTYELTQRLVQGKVTRTELRNLWHVFRPVLDGKTARGSGVTPPTAPANDPRQSRSLMEAAVLADLQRDQRWLGEKELSSYRVFQYVCPFQDTGSKRIEIDALVLAQHDPNSRPDLHGIEISGSFISANRLQEAFHIQRKYFHYLWYAFASAPTSKPDIKSIPLEAGVLFSSGSDIEIVRQAKKLDPEYVENTALAVLLNHKYRPSRS
jgi:hypothetical protein